MTRSLRMRVVLAAVAAVAIAIAVTGVVLVSTFSSREHRDLDRQLLARAHAVGALNAPAAPGARPRPGSPPPRLSISPALARINQALQTGGELARFVHDGVVDVQFGARPKRGVPWPEASRPSHLETVTVGGEDYRAYTLTPPRGAPASGNGRLEVATPLRDVEDRISSLRTRVIVLGLVALVLASVLAWVLVGVALRSLERLRGAATRVSGTEELGTRLPVGDGPREVDELGMALNAMLARLQEAMEATRRFSADAGHELRTPLTALGTNLEVLARNPALSTEQREAILAELAADQQRMAALLEALQALARGDAAEAVPRETVDVAQLVDAAVDGARRRHPRTTFELAGDDGLVPVDAWPDGLRLAVDNLLDNAARHGRPGGRVTVRAERSGGDTVIAVADDGPGIPEAERASVFGRFVRGEAAGPGGHGLGLALVAQQAALHHGRVEIGTSELGGALVSLVFSSSA
jgi:two-component system sensor histidine kinase PrrB